MTGGRAVTIDRMTVLVLDSRWPNQIPIDVAARISAPVEFTGEVPVSVRWDLGDLVDKRSDATAGWGWLITTDPAAPEVQARVERGETVVTVASLEDPVKQAADVMATARKRGEWEQAQTHETLLEYLDQEAGEFAEAVTSKASDEELKKELSDLLLQVLFHSEIASERHAFAFADVAAAFTEKMRSRAPYLFDGSTGTVAKAEQDRLWEEGKARERGR